MHRIINRPVFEPNPAPPFEPHVKLQFNRPTQLKKQRPCTNILFQYDIEIQYTM